LKTAETDPLRPRPTSTPQNFGLDRSRDRNRGLVQFSRGSVNGPLSPGYMHEIKFFKRDKSWGLSDEYSRHSSTSDVILWTSRLTSIWNKTDADRIIIVIGHKYGVQYL